MGRDGQDGPEIDHDSSRMGQNGPKMAKDGPHGPKMSQKGGKMASRWSVLLMLLLLLLFLLLLLLLLILLLLLLFLLRWPTGRCTAGAKLLVALGPSQHQPEGISRARPST